MPSWIEYLLKVNIALLIFYLFYKLLLSRDTFFGLRRLMLILIVITALIYPLFDLSGWFDRTDNPVSIIYNRLLPDILIGRNLSAVEPQSNNQWIINGFSLLYWAGVTLLTIRSGMELFCIFRSLKRTRRISVGGYTVYYSREKETPYSFFRWIFINPVSLSQNEIDEILIHERTHVRELHSLDILLAQVILILCWFNPFAWLIRNEMRINHEYLADRHVVSCGYDKKTYQYHLIGLKHSSVAAANLCNNFSVLPLKNRIKMLNKKRSRNVLKSKYLVFLPVAALLIFFANCSNEMKHPDGNEKNAPSVNVKNVNPDAADTAYDKVEQMPVFPGGTEGMIGYMSKNIKYPVAAQEAGTEGKVFVQFVVNPDGTVSKVTVVNKVNPVLDEEAMRVVKAMPKWEPGKLNGKAVSVKLTIPVTFKLK